MTHPDMSDDRSGAVRLPGESPCYFVHGLDGWTNCAVHGWSGPREQRSRVLVCPEAATPTAEVPFDKASSEPPISKSTPVDGLREALRGAYTLLVSAEPTLIRDARSGPNETSLRYKAILRDRVTAWLAPFRDSFDAGVDALAAAPQGEPGLDADAYDQGETP